MALATIFTNLTLVNVTPSLIAAIRFSRTTILILGLSILSAFSLTSCSSTDDLVTPKTEVHSGAREAATVLNTDSFDDTKMGSFWYSELMTSTAGLLSAEQHRVGKKAMRFSWKASQADGTNKMLHSELATMYLTNGENERWYGYSSFMPSASMGNDANTVIVSQWHGVADPGYSDTVPPLRFELTSDKLQIVYTASSKPITQLMQTPTSQKIIPLGAALYNRWVDYVVHVKWDSNGSTGVLQVWQNGVLKVDDQKINIGYPQKNKPYWKVGLYCWTGKSRAAERTIYCDDVRIAGPNADYDSVKPGLGDGSARNMVR